MKIVELHFFPGRNIYSHRPVLKMLLDLEAAACFRTDADSGFAGRLLAVLPGLEEHKCSRRRRGGFLERVREGTYLGHVTEHVFLELQSLAGVGMEYGKTRTGPGTMVEIIAEYCCRQAAEILAAAAVDVVCAVLHKEQYDLQPVLDEAKKLAAVYLPGPSTRALLQAARKRDIPYQLLDEGTSLYRLGTGKYQKRIQASVSEHTGCIAVDIACNKPLTKKILARHGLPVPRGRVVQTVAEALAAAGEVGFPVALKPVNGNQGKGVSLNLQSAAEVKSAFAIASAYSSSVLVEAYLVGRHYRFLVVHGEVAAVAERLPAYVVGDGRRSIRELITEENKNPLRGEGHEKPLTKIPVDDLTVEALGRQGLNLETVVPAGKKISVRDNANLSTGGTACDVTGLVHPRQSALAAAAARLVGLDIAGVDVVMEDITLPPENQEGGIIEVNAAPGLRMHLFPAGGKPRNVGEIIVEKLFPPGRQVRVPVFSITGTNGKTTVTRMLEYVMRQHGLQTGMCCTDGLYYNGVLAKAGDLTGPAGASAVLAHPEIEVAVLETARGGIVRRGLGYDRADVAVICNVRPDHLGQDNIESLEDLVHIKSLVAEAVYETGAVVLNADDPSTHTIAERVWASLIYFSLQEDNITVRRHLGKGGRALFVRRGTIVAAQGNKMVLVGKTRDFAVTFGGRARHQVENLLASLAACWGFGLSPRQAAFYLRNFAANPQDNPGRSNLYHLGAFSVMIDYGHNADSFAKMGELARKLKPHRILAVMGVPGDRCDDLIIAAGEAAARAFDVLLIKEDEDLRGRKPGEVALLLKQGALQAGKKPAKLHLFRYEREALRFALKVAMPGDLILVFYERLDTVLAEIAAVAPALPPQQKSTQAVNMENPVALT
ncbi:MAG TPA: cyanophycin synthetase [Firmicutes bacterium]|nr:cyanophycin synthetase [Bacillota bacterium]